MGSEYDVGRERRKKQPLPNIRTVQEGHQFIEEEDYVDSSHHDIDMPSSVRERGQQRRSSSQQLGGRSRGNKSPLKDCMMQGPGHVMGRGGGDSFIDTSFDTSINYSGELLPRSITSDSNSLRGRGDSKAVRKVLKTRFD